MNSTKTLTIANTQVKVVSTIQTSEPKVGSGKHVRFTFPNGYVVSVVKTITQSALGDGRYSGYYSREGEDEHELAILLDDDVVVDTGIEYIDSNGDTHCIDGAVCQYISREEVNQILRKITQL